MKKLFVLIVSLFLLGNNLKAQIHPLFDQLVESYDSNGFYYLHPEVLLPGQLDSLFHANFPEYENYKLEIKKTWADDILNMEHYRYQLFFHDIPIQGAEFTEHVNNGYVEYLNGKMAINITDNRSEMMSEEDALNIILSPEEIYIWQVPEMEEELKDELNDTTATYYPDGELVWALYRYDSIGAIIPESHYRLAWKFDIECFDPEYHMLFYVDAVTGQLIKLVNQNIGDGPANIAIYGQKTIDTEWKGGLTQKHILKANNNGRNIHTKYFKKTNVWWWIPNVKDDDDNWGSDNQEATTAHWMVTQAWDYFESTYGRTGLDDNGKELKVKAYYMGISTAYSNKSFERDFITFGTNRFGNHDATLDLAGHEYNHGIDEYTAEMEYVAESGALDESFADIIGCMVEFYAENSGGVTDWLIGEDSDTLRSMSEPWLYGRHVIDTFCTESTGQPTTYNGNRWTSFTNCNWEYVHNNSSIQNYWFYLLAMGGSGTNDLGQAYNITGIGLEKASLIAFWNHTNNMQNNSQFIDARSGSIAFARKKYGVCSNEEIQTTNAWAAVGLGSKSNCTSTEVINETKSPFSIEIYPNPTSNVVQVSTNKTSDLIYFIYDVNGKIVQKGSLNMISNRTIDLSILPNGVYTIKFESGNEYSFNKVIII